MAVKAAASPDAKNMVDAVLAEAEAVAASLRSTCSASIEVWINGSKHTIDQPDPEMTLLEYLRGVGLTGTKLGCGEVRGQTCLPFRVLASSPNSDSSSHHHHFHNHPFV